MLLFVMPLPHSPNFLHPSIWHWSPDHIYGPVPYEGGSACITLFGTLYFTHWVFHWLVARGAAETLDWLNGIHSYSVT